jgi:hypothetical protein
MTLRIATTLSLNAWTIYWDNAAQQARTAAVAFAPAIGQQKSKNFEFVAAVYKN